MAYNVKIQESNFFIDKKYFVDITLFFDSHPVIVRQWYLENIDSIEELFYDMGWKVSFDKDGNLVNVFTEDNFQLYDQADFLNFIKDFIKDGSYIQCLGEDGEQWRWTKHNGKIVTHFPKLVWEI